MSDAAWSFAVGFYARDGVAAACVRFQDAHGGDVDLALYLLHLAETRRVITSEEVARLDGLISGWREQVIIPLRQVRRDLKRASGSYAQAEILRQAVAAAEIHAERMQLDFLAAVSVDAQLAASPSIAARTSLSAYCGHLGVPQDAAAGLLDLFERYTADGETDR